MKLTPWSLREPRLSSVGHKTKQGDRNVGNGPVGRRGLDRGGRETREGELSIITMYYRHI